MRYLMFVLAALLPVPALAQSPAVTRLTDPQDDYPDVSRDGATILFQSNRSGTWQIWRMAMDGSGLGRVTNDSFNHRQPAWSPDGKLVAYSSDQGLGDGKRAIWLMATPGSDQSVRPRKLSSGAGQDVHPKWLPDGSGLVFNRIAADGRQADVHVVTLDGREQKIELGAGLNTYASVDPAGRVLVYRGTMPETGPNGPMDNSDIFAAAPDGSGKKRLTDDPAFDGWPAISPDGATIAFASRRGGDKFRIFLMSIEGGEAREVASPAGFHYTQPAWSPDGRSLIVYRWNADSAGEAGQLVRMALP